MNPGLYLFVLFASLATWLPLSHALAAGNDVVIGVLAHRGNQACIRMWTPTIDYLNEEIPGSEFRLMPLDLQEMSAALAAGKLDFILTNPGNYVDLERRFGVSRITTLKNLNFGNPYTVFGAVIFTRADRADIRELGDLDGKSFGAVAEDAFGGFQMAWRELKEAGVDPYRDLSRLQFFDFPQDDIVFAVRDRLIDAGTVRAETLERMISNGRVERADFHILNALSSDDYPFPHSTRLYPEWAFAKGKRTPGALAKAVAIALMKMPADHPATIAGDYAGWTVPLNYQPVHELFMELGIGPYQRPGMSAFKELLARYWYWLVLLVAAVLFSVIHNILVKRQVKLRTRELSQTNRVLETEVAERKKAEGDARTLLEEKRFLAQKCMAVQEEERRYLARELHDELGQCITAIQADAEIIQDLSGACDGRLKTSAAAIQSVSSRIYEVVHSLMLRYRPGVLDDLGLVETIRDEIGAWQARQPDTVYTLNVSSGVDALGEDFNICVYRIIQECLTNIAKYAHATSVHIEIRTTQAGTMRRLHVEVQDNGAGFDPCVTRGGFGLVGMRERVEALQGEFTLNTKPGAGTRITIELPLDGSGGQAGQ
jgi:two-component system sensor histidine kinase TtrS